MSDNLDNPSMGNFSIQNTMDMGAGSAELLNDLMGPETSTTDPEDIQKIVAEVEDPAPAPSKPRGKEVTPLPENATPEQEGQTALSNFLGDSTDEDEDDNEAPIAPKKPVASSEDSEEETATGGTQFSALANDLFNLGVFSKDEDEEDISISTPEEFLERFNAEKKKGASEMVENFIAQFGEDYQNAFDAIFVKGVNPKDYYNVYNTALSFAELDLSNESNQEKIVKQGLLDQGFDADDVETEIERLKNYGDLETVATKHHKVLVKKEAQKLQQLEATAEKELQQKASVRNQYINNVQSILGEKLKTKEFDGIPLNPKIASEVQDFLLVDKWKTPTGETLSDFDKVILDLKRPENHATKVKVALLLKMLEKDPTLSTIQKTGITKKSNELFGEVARQVTKSKTSGTGGTTPNSNKWFI
jgi:hypothetical protein